VQPADASSLISALFSTETRLASALQRGEEAQAEIRWRREDGKTALLHLQASPLGEGCVLIQVRDLTSLRRKSGETIAGARKPQRREGQGQEAVATDSQPLSPTQVLQWAASVAHEIRNPLSAIGNCIEILEKQLNPQGDQKELIEIALRECERLDRVLSNLLSFTRRSQPLLQSIEVHELMERILAAVPYDTRFKPSISIVRQFDAPLQQALRIDRDQISQVLWNLLINAMQAMPQGGQITIATRIEEDAWFRLSVRDTGVGMSPEVVQKALQPFFTTKKSGTGLGLAMAKQIVESHGGRLRLQSKEGKGTEVTLFLPLP
jgi:signal transduction histidine kinase